MDQQTKWQQILDELQDTAMEETNMDLFETYQNALRGIKKQAKQYLDEYETLTFAKRLEVERLLDVGEKIKGILDKANGTVTDAIKTGAAEQAKLGYYGTYYGLEGAENVNMPISILNENYIEKIVNQPVDGKTLSKRLYKNTTQLAKTTTQSIIQGAIDGKGYAYVAKRIADQTESTYKRALRIARTEGGRVSSLATQKAYQEAQDAGVGLQKRWLSTLDKKTRHSHQDLDGQTVGIDENFVSPKTGATGQGPRLMGRASEDINCRCTTIAIVDGIEPALRRDNESKEMIQNMTYNEWLEFKGLNGPATPAAKTTHKTANGKLILNAHLDNDGKYEYDIEYVMNKQGYDGLPQVVDQATFDEAVKKSNFYAERTYSASSQEVLDAYRKQLYEGEWYVDCGGGTYYGQGMYTAGVYDLDDANALGGIEIEMMSYQELGIDQGKPFFYTEQITLTPDAKIFNMIDGDTSGIKQEWRNKAFIQTITDPEKIKWVNDYSSIETKTREARAAYDAALGTHDRDTLDALESVYRKFRNEKRDLEENNWKLYDNLTDYTPGSDIGVLAAELGYDAINAVGAGRAGSSYTIILNRTKTILKSGGK